MMPRSLAWVLVIVGLLCTGPVRASVWFSSIPSSVQSGTGYYVEASASGGSFNLTIYKNGGYFVGTSGSGWGSVGGSTTDYGAQSVQYWAELYDWNTMEYDNAYASVTITVDTTSPSVPAGLGGSSVTMTSFTLSWSASTDDTGVTEYEVRRDSTSLGTTGSTSMGITGLTLNTTYGMTVRARDAIGNWSDWSSVCNVTTANDTTPPSVPAGLSGGTPGLTSFTLSWSASSDNIGVTAYEVMRDTTSLGTTGATSLNVTGLAPSTTYAMKVQARDAAGNWSGWSSVLNVTTAADSDGDGLSNDEEIALGTNPNGGSSNTDDSSNTTLELKIHKPN